MSALLSRLLRPRSSGLRRDEGGAAALEFALVSPMLILFIVGIIEVAMILFVSALLEGSVREAARYGITGYTISGSSRVQIVRNIVASNTVGMIDMSKVTITTLTYSSFSNIGKPEPFNDANHNGIYDVGESFTDVNGNGKWDADMGAFGVGGAGDVVVYTVSYNWPLLTRYLSNVMGLNIPLSASYAVRNEPWN